MNAQAAPNPPDERQKQEALRLTDTLTNALGQPNPLAPGQQQAATECLAAIRERLAGNGAPHKTQLDDLMKAVGEDEPLTTQAMQLAELFGYLPSL
ncbi:MAG: hypothetical protein AVDCRST_MAG56-7883 [uncultured Cytophagales bacterium]|uniref:Uncharacterized protein n=1 Tax=uncultured Cytophagales bacterium TaxID=158755 RepID=A0A6J4LTC9_9SPHI|nr:MAG: hypothetical protein AVDCRST_MAG56-7883 [uncultured Cytophagales bacterium]